MKAKRKQCTAADNSKAEAKLATLKAKRAKRKMKEEQDGDEAKEKNKKRKKDSVEPNEDDKKERAKKESSSSDSSNSDSSDSDSSSSRSSSSGSSDSSKKKAASNQEELKAKQEPDVAAPPKVDAAARVAEKPKVLPPKGMVCAKMMARSGLRCPCHFQLMKKCPARDDVQFEVPADASGLVVFQTTPSPRREPNENDPDHIQVPSLVPSEVPEIEAASLGDEVIALPTPLGAYQQLQTEASPSDWQLHRSEANQVPSQLLLQPARQPPRSNTQPQAEKLQHQAIQFNEPELPDGWRTMWSRSQERTYYLHIASGKSSWTMPRSIIITV